MSTPIERGIVGALGAFINGEPHRHHRNCIHNLSPQEQYEVNASRTSWTYEQWVAIRGGEPVQITPDAWEIDPPEWTNLKALA